VWQCLVCASREVRPLTDPEAPASPMDPLALWRTTRPGPRSSPVVAPRIDPAGELVRPPLKPL